MLKLFSRKSNKGGTGITRISGDRFAKIEGEAIEDNGRSLCLDVGSGVNSVSDTFVTIDMDDSLKPDYVLDIRVLFAPSNLYRDRIGLYPDAKKLNHLRFKVIRLSHIIEHVEWLYQRQLFEWLKSILLPGGILIISAPNLEYIAKMYLANIEQRIEKGLPPKYPNHEHPDFVGDVAYDLERWANMKLFSGCSPGDYHYACYDQYWLNGILVDTGFSDIKIHSGTDLQAVAYSVEESNNDIDDAIDRVIT